MFTVNILLKSVDRVIEFINIVSRLDANMDIICGKYIINAKSTVGIFTLDLSQPLELCIHKDVEDAEETIAQLSGFIV